MLPSLALQSKRDQILALVAARGASRLRVFGSVARGQDHEGSDVDLLIEVPVGTSLLQIVGLQLEIEDALGVRVDLCTESDLHPQLAPRILAEARAL
jgi:predicted nucleotidyltransferase